MKKTFTLVFLFFACTVIKAQTFTGSLALDGNAQFAALPTGVLNGASIFTIEFWVKTTESRTSGTFWQRPYLIGLATNGNNSGDFGISTDNGYISMFEGFSTMGIDQTFESPTVKINDNNWHHIAAVNNGATLYLYVDGNIVDSVITGYAINTANAPLTIGAASLDFNAGANSYANTSFPSQGTFAEMRISNSVRYTGNFSPATAFTPDANTVALYHFTGLCGLKGPDATTNGNTLTVNNSTTACSSLPFNNRLTFNGVNQYIKTPYGLLNNASNFTVETWFKSTDVTTNSTFYLEPTIFGTENAGANSGDFAVTTQGGYLQAWADIGNGTINIVGKAFICDGQWHHIAAVANGSSIVVYADGVAQGTFTMSRGINTAAQPLTFMRLASASYGAVGFHAGELDEIRISDIARYTANFNPATAAFANGANTTALYHLNTCSAGTTPDAGSAGNTAQVFGITACGLLSPQHLQAKILYSHHNGNAVNLPDSIYTLDSTGNRAFVTFGYRPRLSHNGRFLAFSNGPNSNQSFNAGLWIRDLVTGDERLIVSNSGDYLDYYDFYPSDTKLVYSQGCSIYTTNIDGSSAYTYIGGYPGDCFSDDPAIRLSDSAIAYHNAHFGLFTMGQDGSSPLQVPNTVPGDLDPSWSPDGKWLAYYKPIPGSYNPGAGAYIPTNSVYKIKPDGSDSIRLSFLSVTDTLAADPIWSKDMKSLYAIGRIKDTVGIYQISTDGSGEYHRIYTFADSTGTIADYWMGLSDSVKSNILPVSLINFTGINLGKAVRLNWQTTQEINSSYFDVERSTNGARFNKIGSVTAQGNSSVTNNYSYTDAAAPLTGDNVYYRLKQVDKDGRYAYTNVVAISMKTVTSLLVYPNPNRGIFNIITKNTSAKLEVAIDDAAGRRVYHQVYTNTNAALVNLPAAKGLYLITITDGKTTTHEKIVVQ